MFEDSYMVIIPANENDIKEPSVLISNIVANDHMTLKSHEFDENRGIVVELEVDGAERTIVLNPVNVNIPEFVRVQHLFDDVDVERVNNTEVGLEVSMMYEGDSQVCYHDQLKILHALVPDKLAVMDASSEKMLSGKWVALAAESKVAPAPRYIYTVQAISGDEDQVWLHTHGLGRCGITELEILNSTKEMYNTHYSIIETLANRLLEREEPLEYGEPMFIAWVTEEIPMVVTIVDWRDAIKNYPEDIIGGIKDREDEYHTEETSCIMAFANPDDIETGTFSPVMIFDEYIVDNPLLMISDRETDRMRNLARERFHFLEDIVEREIAKGILVKIGLQVDEEFMNPEKDPGVQKEHIWFELKSLKDGVMECELTQDPYYVKSLKPGDICKYTVNDVTDWMVFTEERRITPDDVYMIM